MTWLEIGTIGGSIVGAIGIILVAQRHNNHSRSRIYTRLDACKKGLEEKMNDNYSRKDICELRHLNVERELKEIKEKTDLIPGIAAKLEVLVKNGSNSG